MIFLNTVFFLKIFKYFKQPFEKFLGLQKNFFFSQFIYFLVFQIFYS